MSVLNRKQFDEETKDDLDFFKTTEAIRSRYPTDKYREGWERIFGNKPRDTATDTEQ